MKAKHSVVLLSGLLLMMIGIAWAQSSNTSAPTCPAVADEYLQEMLMPTAWARADWNATTSRWEIDCNQLDAVANMAGSLPANAYNSASNATRMSNAVPSRGRRRSGGNGYWNINSSPYNSAYNGVYNAANSSVWANAVNANRPATKARPNTRRP